MRTWADDFHTYEEACTYYGVDTPAQLKAEDEYWAEVEARELAEMEVAFGPYVSPPDNEFPF